MRSHIPLRSLGATLLLLAAAACTSTGGSDPAQGSDADLEARRARKQAATKTFLDPEAPKTARLEAAQNLGYPEEETFDAMLEVGADPAEDDEIRWEALRQHRFDDAYLDVVLAILDDPDDGGAELDTQLIEDIGRRTTFELPDAVEQKIVATLHKLLDDPRDRVRLAAYRVLVGIHDTVAVSRLTDALRADDPPIPLDEAIRLLDIDGSVFHLDVIRPYLNHSEDSVRAEAARALAVDPDSRPRIVELTLNPSTDKVVRLRAIRALAREDDRFAGYAIRLVANRQEDPKVRYAAMKAFVGRMNYFDVDPKDQVRFAEVVETLARDRTPRNEEAAWLQAEARKLFVYLKKAFPVIENHYASQ